MRALLGSVGQDLRYALRGWRERPWFTAALVLMLALGIAAVTSVFAVAYAELWRPSPYPQPGQLVTLHGEFQGHAVQLTAAEFRLLQKAPGFASVAAEISWSQTLVTAGTAEQVGTVRVSPNYLPLLGVQPALGRDFLPTEAVPGRDGEAIISYSLWRSRFGGRLDVLGRSLRLDDRLYTVIGVMPPHFYEGTRGGDAIWLPAAFTATDLAPDGPRNVSVWGRLAPGVTWPQEQPRLAAYSATLHLTFAHSPLTLDGDSYARYAHYSPGRAPLLALLGAVALLLLIACANAGGLLLARSLEREHEIAIRRALGAGRGRILRQLLTEGVLLAAVAAGLGLLLAQAAIAFLRASPLQFEVLRLAQARLDPAVLAFALAATVASVLLFSLAPALRLTRSLQPGLAARVAAGQWTRAAFLVAEVALTFILLVGAGLMAKSLFALETRDPGFDLDHLAAVEFAFTPQQRRQPAQVAAVADRVMVALRGRPGWRQAAIAATPPLDDDFARLFTIAPSHHRDNATWHAVGPNYFAAVGQHIVLGRGFDARDTAAAPGVVIVNQAFARYFFHGASPLGAQLIWTDRGAKSATPHTIVGVVNDARDWVPDLAPPASIYAPYAQSSSSGLALLVNAADPAAAVDTLRRVLAQSLPDLPVATAQPLRAFFRDDIAQPRFQDLMLMAFATLALLFALSGIWALVAFVVEQRRQEFGIRLALGATSASLLRHALRQTLLLTSFGVLIGLAVAWAVTRILASLLFDTAPTDPATFAAVTLLFAVVACFAAYLPARSACDTDPALCLRHQ